ncbi:MAG: tRNA (adenosine(37)-N6)-threonylcarbamoyltransferase complex ATPase subunit type 1 TsaE [Dissulfuribacterales bacterium]
MKRTFISHSPSETCKIGMELAKTLLPGDVLLLSGDLGAGKTAFVKGIAAGLGIEERRVTSPSFGLIHEYKEGVIPLAHADLYRLGPNISEEGLEEIGLYEYLDGKWILAVEWPEHCPDFARLVERDHAIAIHILWMGKEEREIEISMH